MAAFVSRSGFSVVNARSAWRRSDRRRTSVVLRALPRGGCLGFVVDIVRAQNPSEFVAPLGIYRFAKRAGYPSKWPRWCGAVSPDRLRILGNALQRGAPEAACHDAAAQCPSLG